MRRLQQELRAIHRDGGVSPTIHVLPHGNDLTTMEAFIIGPPDTPYDAGVFHFRLKFPMEYPLVPPQVRFLTTDGGTLRFHPQLYADGKVCLSILNTWQGPQWTAQQSLRSILLSIQSLLDEEPLRCEPGLERAPEQEVQRGNDFVAHETVRVAILDTLAHAPGVWGVDEGLEDLAAVVVFAEQHLAGRRPVLVERLARLAERCDTRELRPPFAMLAAHGARHLARRCDFAGLRHRLLELPLMSGVASQGIVETVIGSDSGHPQSSVCRDPADEGLVQRRPSRSKQASAADECTEKESEREEEVEKGVGPSVRAEGGHEDEEEEKEEAKKEEEDEEEVPLCRICHLDAEESSLPLIQPCLCAGSMRWVHSDCLVSWMRRAPSSSYRCDVCRCSLTVRLGGGVPLGAAYFRRDLDDPEFEDTGLVAVLLTSSVQIAVTIVDVLFGQAALHVVKLFFGLFYFCLPWGWAKATIGVVEWLLEIPLALVDLTMVTFYASCVAFKALVMLGGAQWRPEDWGETGQLRFAPPLDELQGWLADLGIGLRTLSVLVGLVALKTLIAGALACALADRGSESSLLSPPLFLPQMALPAATSALPPAAARILLCAYGYTGFVSVAVNGVALVYMLKRAFMDRRPVPTEVLSMPSCQADGGRFAPRSGPTKG